MSPKLPVISGDEAIKVFLKVGYRITRQRGSHVRMKDSENPEHKPLSVPRHKVIKPGLLKKLMRDSALSVEQFTDLLED